MMLTHVVAKTILFDDVGNLLVLWRATDDVVRPGGFDFPGGKVDNGEDIPAGATRELAEEAGLQLSETDLQLVFATTKAAYNIEAKTEVNIVWLGFVAKWPKGQTVKLSHEHQRFEWLSIDQALAICDSPSQHAFLEHLQANNLML
jgi:8-oxo-dGTP pyrophosphatase MutT (NUDIX family)